MRQLNISNEKKRDAFVALDNRPKKKTIRSVLEDGRESRNVKILRGTQQTSLEQLKERHRGDLVALGEEIIQADPELDFEQFGRILNTTASLYLDHADQIVYRVHIKEIVRNPDGSIREEREAEKREVNVTESLPLRWTGKSFPKEVALKKFVFTRKYQLKHVNGLTYDFLYDMAKKLQESNALMFVGGGAKGTDPIILTAGGEPHRGFLEGRVDGDKYCLILHLTHLELKSLTA